MNKPFVPELPEKIITIKASGKEANLIKILRKYPFGKFVVHKVNGVLVRIEINDSRMIKEENGLDLAIDEASDL